MKRTSTTGPMDAAEISSAKALLRLLAWLSPAFPVGSFSYSHGLERAVHDGLVTDAADLREWIEQLLRYGTGWNDAVLFAEAGASLRPAEASPNSPCLRKRLPDRASGTWSRCFKERLF